MRKVGLAILITLAVVRTTWANPSSDFEQMDVVVWVVRSFPLNYSVDLLFLMLALAVTKQMPSSGWKLVPAYAFLVCLGGYFADFFLIWRRITGRAAHIWMYCKMTDLCPVVC